MTVKIGTKARAVWTIVPYLLHSEAFELCWDLITDRCTYRWVYFQTNKRYAGRFEELCETSKNFLADQFAEHVNV